MSTGLHEQLPHRFEDQSVRDKIVHVRAGAGKGTSTVYCQATRTTCKDVCVVQKHKKTTVTRNKKDAHLKKKKS